MMSGNKGAALGKQYTRFLYKNIRLQQIQIILLNRIILKRLCSCMKEEGSSEIKLVILTVNLIKRAFYAVTQKNLLKNILIKVHKKFHVEKSIL